MELVGIFDALAVEVVRVAHWAMQVVFLVAGAMAGIMVIKKALGGGD